jgi:hypothetical protein
VSYAKKSLLGRGGVVLAPKQHIRLQKFKYCSCNVAVQHIGEAAWLAQRKLIRFAVKDLRIKQPRLRVPEP